MQRTLLKSKIHRVTVTEAELHYEGSVTIDAGLLEAADIIEHEQVDIYNVTGGQRLSTYAIAGAPGSGRVCINGAAAHLVRPGDLIIIASYARYDESDVRRHHPRIVHVDEQNRIRQSDSGHPSP